MAPNTVGSLSGAFSGEIGAQKLRARTAGISQGLAVVSGLIFKTTLPLMRKYLSVGAVCICFMFASYQ